MFYLLLHREKQYRAQWFSNFKGGLKNIITGPHFQNFWVSRPWVRHKYLLSYKFLSNADAVGLGTALWELLIWENKEQNARVPLLLFLLWPSLAVSWLKSNLPAPSLPHPTPVNATLVQNFTPSHLEFHFSPHNLYLSLSLSPLLPSSLPLSPHPLSFSSTSSGLILGQESLQQI